MMLAIDRIDGDPARLADAERGRPIEDRCPGRAAVPRQPHAAPSRADVDDVGVVRMDSDRGDLAVAEDRAGDRALIDRARPDRCPDRSVQAHCSGRFSVRMSLIRGCVSSEAGSPTTGSIDGLTRTPANRYHCSRASA